MINSASLGGKQVLKGKLCVKWELRVRDVKNAFRP